MNARPANRLSREKSPYLLQHAVNPVDWFPWCEEAFEKAEKEDKPIFLSIGYSTCHWCHVMEKESFEDEEVASLMNRAFVSIKVDREERPDIDSLYMNVCTMLTGRGGWPLTIIMTPDKKPFFAATYLPKQSGPRMTGMLDLVPAVERAWKQERKKAEHSADKILDHLKKSAPAAGREEIPEGVLDTAYRQLRSSYDPREGGFGSAPKFPSPQNLLFLLRAWRRTGTSESLHMVETTLRSMRMGGIWDHVGFGFHRYATDAHWLLPHFEKMLYDQAMISIACLETYHATKDRFFARTAEEIFTYVLRDLHAPEGGFYSAEDADSEGEEGKFYIWSREEFRKLLQGLDADKWERILDIREEGNFQEESTGKRTGSNILHLSNSLEEWAEEVGQDIEELLREWEEVRLRLFEQRGNRIRPLRDDKILTDWNGMMIAALSKGGRILGKEKYASAARDAADFIIRTMEKDGLLLHRFREGEAAILGLADDYAYLIWGLLELFQTEYEPNDLATAMWLQDLLDEQFWDEKEGGYFLTSRMGKDLPVRPKEIYDGPYPSANSVALQNLFRLARLTWEVRREERAKELMRTFSSTVAQQPAGYPHFLSGVGYGFIRPREIVVVGREHDRDAKQILSHVHSTYAPYQSVVFKTERNRKRLGELAPYVRDMKELNEKATAYVCSGFACSRPTSDPQKIKELLEQE